MMSLVPEIEESFQQLKKWRHDLHQHPELSFNEQRTSEQIIRYLKQFGVDEIHPHFGGHGVLAIIRNGDGPGIGLRADMDALPIHEKSMHSYCSKYDGVMHACGHDGHVVMLLGAAQYLAKHRHFQGTVVCIFQPAEEKIAGAPAMLQAGLLQRFPIESIYTLHSWPGASTSTLNVNVGSVMASVNNFDIRIKCSGGHAARPQHGGDPILAGSEIVSNLQAIVSRKVNPNDALVISCTVFQGGNVYNIIPNEVTIKGTARFVNPELQHVVPEKMHQIIQSIATAHDVHCEFSYKQQCPPTFNTEKEALLARQVAESLLGPGNGASKEVSMGSDDFCFYLEEVPGAYVYIGNGESSAGLHHAKYDFNDEALTVGASFYARLVESSLPK